MVKKLKSGDKVEKSNSCSLRCHPPPPIPLSPPPTPLPPPYPKFSFPSCYVHCFHPPTLTRPFLVLSSFCPLLNSSRKMSFYLCPPPLPVSSLLSAVAESHTSLFPSTTLANPERGTKKKPTPHLHPFHPTLRPPRKTYLLLFHLS